MTHHEIGGVIYVLSYGSKDKGPLIFPGIVLEEVRCRRLDGESVSYKIAVGPSGSQKVVDLSKIDGAVYSSLEEVKEAMVATFTTFVDEKIELASRQASAWYAEQLLPIHSDRIDPSTFLNDIPVPPTRKPATRSTEEDDFLTRDVVMPDGSIQKVRVTL